VQTADALFNLPVVQPATVRKRDGHTVQPFDVGKVESAVRKAWAEAEGAVDEEALQQVATFVAATLRSNVTDVEQIQDAVEVALMRAKQFKVAKAYIIYRQKRTEARAVRRKPDAAAVSDYIHASKYARHVPEIQRREVYDETVARVELMHQKRFGHLPQLRQAITRAFDLVRDKRVLPSMRSMQFGGAAVEANNNRLYNCSASLVDRPRVFAEAMFLLLSGCGVGYSVQIEHVEKLPPLTDIDEKKVVHHVIDDTIEGWSMALDALINSYIHGYYVEFSFHKIRGAGVPLKTSGGRAPGHQKLKLALDRIRKVLHSAQGRQLRPIECHRILCHAADAVLSGGIRRSAMICLFSIEDSELMHVKSDRDWYDKEPWLANANNSVVLKRDEVKEKQFKRIFGMTKNFGEPGVLFVSDYNHVTNPCAEIGLDPILVNEDGTTSTGWAMCNLCEINASKLTSFEDFSEAAWAATFIGTLQATYTDMPFLGKTTEAIVRRDALLGIGMTGMQDAPHIACNPTYQRAIAERVVEWNREYAAILGINEAARTTCVKPSGTTSLELGNVGSGIHPHHARRYIRRVTADELEVVFQAFKATNPHMCVKKPDGKWVIEFPVEAPDGAVIKDDLTAEEFMNMVRSTQQNWVVPGATRASQVPGLSHNVSNTITVRPNEWATVADYLWKHRDNFTGVSLLPDSGDMVYAFAPFEAVKSEAQERRWNELIAGYKPIDYLSVFEAEDGTNLTSEAACANGACNFA
jgi:ribonucleoside-triphosphate reductase (thioredoxin)